MNFPLFKKEMLNCERETTKSPKPIRLSENLARERRKKISPSL